MVLSDIRYIACIVVACALSSCAKQPVEKQNYFNKDEYKQSKSFRLIHHMPYAELKEEKENLIKAGNEYIAIKYVAQMIKKCSDPIELQHLRLEFADMLYHLENCAEAASEYQLYAQLYPGSKEAAYADYQAIRSLHCEVLSADRDQDRTQEIVDMAKAFTLKAQKRADYTAYLQDIERLTHECLHRLYEGEVLRFYFYFNRQQLKAAAARLAWIQDRYSKFLPEVAPEVLELEYELALANRNPEEAHKKETELAKKFPHYKRVPYKNRSYAAIF